jgi:chaperonin GroES
VSCERSVVNRSLIVSHAAIAQGNSIKEPPTINYKPQTAVILGMRLTTDNKFKKLVVIGDRVLIRPAKPNERTESGLYLPPGVQEREKVQQGYVIKTGPGYVIPMPVEDESWKGAEEQVKYVPLQAREGDLAIFLLSGATEVLYEGDKYYIVPQSAILMLEREEDI